MLSGENKKRIEASTCSFESEGLLLPLIPEPKIVEGLIYFFEKVFRIFRSCQVLFQWNCVLYNQGWKKVCSFSLCLVFGNYVQMYQNRHNHFQNPTSISSLQIVSISGDKRNGTLLFVNFWTYSILFFDVSGARIRKEILENDGQDCGAKWKNSWTFGRLRFGKKESQKPRQK